MMVVSALQKETCLTSRHIFRAELEKGEDCGKKKRQCIRGAKTTPNITGNAARWRKLCLPKIFSGAVELFVDGKNP